MKLAEDKAIYLQVAETLEDAILAGAFPEECQVPSTTEISITYRINPATALKGVNLLVAGKIVYKKRGLGMFVQTGAKELIMKKRKKAFYDSYVLSLLEEAGKLGIGRGELIQMLEEGQCDE